MPELITYSSFGFISEILTLNPYILIDLTSLPNVARVDVNHSEYLVELGYRTIPPVIKSLYTVKNLIWDLILTVDQDY